MLGCTGRVGTKIGPLEYGMCYFDFDPNRDSCLGGGFEKYARQIGSLPQGSG